MGKSDKNLSSLVISLSSKKHTSILLGADRSAVFVVLGDIRIGLNCLHFITFGAIKWLFLKIFGF